VSLQFNNTETQSNHHHSSIMGTQAPHPMPFKTPSVSADETDPPLPTISLSHRVHACRRTQVAASHCPKSQTPITMVHLQTINNSHTRASQSQLPSTKPLSLTVHHDNTSSLANHGIGIGKNSKQQKHLTIN
jgi:hypothetical protein